MLGRYRHNAGIHLCYFFLFIAGIFFITLTFGQILLSQPQVIFQNMIYTVVTGVILFAGDYDRCVLPIGNRRSATAPVLQP